LRIFSALSVCTLRAGHTSLPDHKFGKCQAESERGRG
jgi:hypothetical protein